METILVLDQNQNILAYYKVENLEKIIAAYPDRQIVKTSQALPEKEVVGLSDPRTQQEKDDHWKLQQEIDRLKNQDIPIADTEKDNLRIFKFIPRTQNPKTTDFSLLGLEKGVSEYALGRLTKKCWLDGENIVVDQIFEDVTGSTFKIKTTSRWYNRDDSIGLQKEEYKQFSAQEKEKLARDRRQRQVNILIASGRDTPAEQLFSLIYTTYTTLITEFIETATESLKTALETEVDATVLSALNQQVPDLWNEGQTISIRNGILRELYGVEPS